jgi:hypothetical protein
VGNRGDDLLRAYDANQVLSGDRDHDGVDDRLQYVRTEPPDRAALHPFVAKDDPITFWDHGGRSTYHSLQTQFVSRFRRGSQAQASYTLARSRANYQTSSSGTASGSGADLQNSAVDWGRPDMGRTHIFNASLIWLLPALDQRSGLMRSVFGDWEIAAVVGAASGQPVTAYAFIPALNGGPSGTGFGSPQYPIRTNAPCRTDSRIKEQIINPAAYTLNGFPLGTIGGARRGDCTGPNYFQTDMAFSKNARMAGNLKLQFRWENLQPVQQHELPVREREHHAVTFLGDLRRTAGLGHDDRECDLARQLRAGLRHPRRETDADRGQAPLVGRSPSNPKNERRTSWPRNTSEERSAHHLGST